MLKILSQVYWKRVAKVFGTGSGSSPQWDNHEAVEVGGMRQAKVYSIFPEAVIREGARAEEEEESVRRTFIDTTNVEDQRWEPPRVDADWHAFCQATYHGIEGQEWNR